MAYPSDLRPRRRMQAVPTMQQMVKRRAASPGGMPRGGVGYLGPPVQRRRPWNNPGPRPNPVGGGIWQPPGGSPGPVFQGGGRPGANPNQIGSIAGHNPLEHQRYWAAQGWIYNPRSMRFQFVGDSALGDYMSGTGPGSGGFGGPDDGRPNPDGGGRPNQPPGGSPGPIYGGGDGGRPGGGGGEGSGQYQPPAGPNPGPEIPPSDQLPLDPLYEAARRMLADQLTARLAQIAPAREQVMADRGLQEARLNTNEGVDQRRMLESLAGRGAFGGGIQVRDQGLLSTDYLRQRQDLASSVAQALAGLSGQESEANLMYQQGLMEALLDQANRQAMSEYAVTPHPEIDWGMGDWGTEGDSLFDLPPIDTGGGGGGPGPGGGGGGGGNWKPSWQPSWKPDWKPSWQPPRRRTSGGRR